MTNEEMNFIGSMNMCDEISNEAYQKIMTHCEEQEPCDDYVDKKELLKSIEVALDATDINDEYSIGLRNGMRLVKSFVDGKRPDYEKVSHLKEQQPCNDAISRQAVIELVEGWWIGHTKEDDLATEIKSLPPVTPQPKVGEWLEKEINSDNAIEEWQSARCSVCDRYHTTPYMYYFSHYDYCPHCGTKMEGESE